jgi:hypothetical protein
MTSGIASAQGDDANGRAWDEPDEHAQRHEQRDVQTVLARK